MHGSKTIDTDGNFQLSRYSRKNERSKDVVYQGQEEMDRHWVKPENVISYNETANEGCSNFQALNKKSRSKSYLDQTGVFACTCGHGYPLVAMDMATPGETRLILSTALEFYAQQKIDTIGMELMEQHMVPTTSSATQTVIYISGLKSMTTLRINCHLSATSIVEWLTVEHEASKIPLPKSIERLLNTALTAYGVKSTSQISRAKHVD
ncbi:hypothetical protein INT45_008637 [Circinella minor]|uniref:Uncharacterized protein n=1 Tax=Circinella minor TaxID=1195481 RepID=A0A8H7S3Z3_9FUNG|nr:hypothetical protein INT45_008637 [Circinella minor]